MVFIYLLILVAGFFGLIKGADIFVDGSSSIAKMFHIPGLIIGLTIVSMGTSAPEMAVSIVAAVQGSNEIALSNVVGSDMFNILMILGLCSMIGDLPVERDVLRRDFPVMIGSFIFVLPFAASGIIGTGKLPAAMSDNAGMVSRITGLGLLAGFTVYMIFLIRKAGKGKGENEDTGNDGNISLPKCILMIIAGLILIVAGGEIVVYSAKNIARAMGLTETLIGLTVVAMGTSLPECITSVVAAKKGETGLAVGNVLGSNIFNIMFVLGISSTIHPVASNFASMCDLSILIGVSLMAWLFANTRKAVRRVEGLILVLCYAAHLTFAVLR